MYQSLIIRPQSIVQRTEKPKNPMTPHTDKARATAKRASPRMTGPIPQTRFRVLRPRAVREG